MSEDGYEMGNMVFMALCIAIIVMLIVTSLACLCMCQKHSTSPDPEGGVHTVSVHTCRQYVNTVQWKGVHNESVHRRYVNTVQRRGVHNVVYIGSM